MPSTQFTIYIYIYIRGAMHVKGEVEMDAILHYNTLQYYSNTVLYYYYIMPLPSEPSERQRSACYPYASL